MGRGHHSNVNFLRPRAAQPLEFPLLQNAQEFRLQLQRDIADFIQKQRTLVCQLEPANLLSDRTGEGAALVAKKFAFEQPAGNGSAVELYKRPVLPAAAIVNGARDKFLAGARLSQQEHGRIACRHHFDEFQHLPEGWTLPHDSCKACLRTDFFL